jgi:hypothetical protein
VDTREGKVTYSFDENSDSYSKEMKEYEGFRDLENWELICDNQKTDTAITK